MDRLLMTFGVALLMIGALAGPPAAFADQGDCSQPQTTGANPTASDCLFILRAAVGSSTCSPECICDTNSAGGVTATDALVCLKAAVGQPIVPSCPCTTTTSSTSTTSTTASTTTTTQPVTTTTGGPTTTTNPTTTTSGGPTTTTLVTTTTIVDADCPISADLTIVAGTRDACTTNADCNVGTCNDTLGRCQTVTALDTGFTGIAHDADLTDNVVVKANLDCPGPGPACGLCNIAGIDPAPGYCRCANNNAITCDEPFVEDVDDCGAGVACNCYLGPPLALSAGNTPACVTNRLFTDVTGTTNVDEGSGSTSVELRATVFTGEGGLHLPCPVCGGTCTAGLSNTTTCFFDSDCDTNFQSGDGVCGNFDPTPGDGVKDGSCHLGRNPAAPCDIDAFNQSFPAPGGGGHSLDCFPTLGKNVSGAGLIIKLVQTTGTSSIAAAIPCKEDFGGTPLSNCQCAVCSLNAQIPCSSNADCDPAITNGECRRVDGAHPVPHKCDTTCTDIGGGEGQCDDPSDTTCDALVRANGDGFIGCLGNGDCAIDVIGLAAGQCTLSKKRACFLPTISATGDPDPQFPVGAAVFCIPPTNNPAINDTAGLPGPGRVVNQGIVEFQCNGGVYEPGVGCPPIP